MRISKVKKELHTHKKMYKIINLHYFTPTKMCSMLLNKMPRFNYIYRRFIRTGV